METKPIIQSDMHAFLKPKANHAILIAVCAVLLLASVAAAIVGARAETPASVRFSSDLPSGTYVYSDVLLLTEWVYRVTGDTSYTFYELMDDQGDWHVVSLDKSDLTKLSAQIEACALLTDSTTADDLPKPVRLYGMTRSIKSDDLAAMAEGYGITNAEYEDFFGRCYLAEGAEPTNDLSTFGLLGALFFGIFLLIALILFASEKKTRRICANRLYARGEEQLAESEFSDPDNTVYEKAKLVFSKHFIYGGTTGAVISYEDIGWLFRHVTRTNGIQTSVELNASLINGTAVSLARKGVTDMLVGDAMQLIGGKNPNALLGYSNENRKAYRARVKEWKAQNR